MEISSPMKNAYDVMIIVGASGQERSGLKYFCNGNICSFSWRSKGNDMPAKFFSIKWVGNKEFEILDDIKNIDHSEIFFAKKGDKFKPVRKIFHIPSSK